MNILINPLRKVTAEVGIGNKTDETTESTVCKGGRRIQQTTTRPVLTTAPAPMMTPLQIKQSQSIQTQLPTKLGPSSRTVMPKSIKIKADSGIAAAVGQYRYPKDDAFAAGAEKLTEELRQLRIPFVQGEVTLTKRTNTVSELDQCTIGGFEASASERTFSLG